MKIILDGVQEYAEHYDVVVKYDECDMQLTVDATNEGGYNMTSVDLIQLVTYLKCHYPDFIAKCNAKMSPEEAMQELMPTVEHH